MSHHAVPGSGPTSGPTSAADYTPGSPGWHALRQALDQVGRAGYDIASRVGDREVRTGRVFDVAVPHDHHRLLGQVHAADASVVDSAIESAGRRWRDWSARSFDERAEPFSRAADMLEFGPWRHTMVAACMLELSKTVGQADGDAAAETVDFLRANLANAAHMATIQPGSAHAVSNSIEYRPLEGFVLAVSPFNFASMNNLALGPALLGNTVIWKPAENASLMAHLMVELMAEAGLPSGVLNVLYGDGAEIGSAALAHPDLAAVAFTGSTATFRHIWRTVGEGVARYRNYPRVVGETGGKDFVVAHPSADVDALAVALIRGAFEYAGQKCAAASRLYVPRSLWPALRDRLVEQTQDLVMGDPTDPGTFLGAVISERQHTKHEAALARARADGMVVVGGATDSAVGWFVQPTVLEVGDPRSAFMTEELFGPILTAFVFEDSDWRSVLRLVDESTEYGLTGSVFATDEAALAEADHALRYTAGNYYVNDKPSGATVGQQPFGGARASGTNDKAGTVWNLIRFVSPRTIKRNHQPARTLT